MVWTFSKLISDVLPFGNKVLTKEMSVHRTSEQRSHVCSSKLPHSPLRSKEEGLKEEWNLRLAPYLQEHP